MAAAVRATARSATRAGGGRHRGGGGRGRRGRIDRRARARTRGRRGALVLGVAAEWFVRRRVHAWGYAEREDDLLVRRGVMFSRLSVVPYGRMQFIDVTAGPFERAFGLATVRMHTAAAASDARIPGLERDGGGAAARPARGARGGAGGRAVSEPDGWRRLHPLSPIVRGGRADDRDGDRHPADASSGRGSRDRSSSSSASSPSLVALGFLSWLVTRWRVDRDDLQIETGLLRRQSLRFPLSQVQAIDVVRPGLARLFGVAELRLRMGGASGKTGRLAYLHEREVEPLRGRLLALADSGAEEPDAPRRGGRTRRARPRARPDRAARRVDPHQRRRHRRRGGRGRR